MVRMSSKTATATAAAAATESVEVVNSTPSVVESVTTSAPVKEKRASKKSSKKVDEPVTVVVDAAPAAPAPVIENVVVETVELTEVLVEHTEVTLSTKMTDFSARLQQALYLLSSLKNEFKAIEKVVSRDIKAAQKASSKKSKRTGNRQPSGFVKPTKISDELANFLEKPIGTEIARTVVSKEINNYIRANQLQDPANGRKINPDAKLTQLLKMNPGDELTYFNLQRYMKHHFVKMSDDASALASASVSATF